MATIETRQARQTVFVDTFTNGLLGPDVQMLGPVADEEADARILYRVLVEIGGRELVGPAPDLDSGTFYRAIPGG